jgi:hypothetical protein
MRFDVELPRVRIHGISMLAGLVIGVLCVLMLGAGLPRGTRPDDPGAKPHAEGPGVKAPIAEVLHCPLAFAGVHLVKELPERSAVAYHYCKPLNDEVSQCVLYDGTGPDARLIGVEYLVSDAIYQKMSADEKAYWHDHKFEVDRGLIRSLIQSGDEEKATLAKLRTLWGKTYHTWASGRTYPQGPARLFWSVTGEEPFVLGPEAKLPAELDGMAGRQPANERPSRKGEYSGTDRSRRP